MARIGNGEIALWFKTLASNILWGGRILYIFLSTSAISLVYTYAIRIPKDKIPGYSYFFYD